MNLSPPRTKSSPLYERMDYEEEENYDGGNDNNELKEFLEGGGDMTQRSSRKPQWKSMSSPKRGRNSNPNSNNRCHYITLASITVNLILATTIIYVLSSSPSLRISPFSLSSSSSASSNSLKQHNNVTNISDDEDSRSSSSTSTTHPSTGSTKYSHIALLGERNSGTTWTHAHLEQCFGHAISVRNRLTRHKHWFQEDLSSKRERAAAALDDSSDEDDDDNDNDNDDDNEDTRRQRKRRKLFDYGKTLVIAQFRDPVYWVDAMRRKPHHSPMHYGYEKNQWRDFLSVPWTLPVRPINDQRHMEQFTLYRHDPTSRDILHPPCHEGFMPHQMMTCLRSPWAYVNEVSHRNDTIPTNEDYADGDQHGKINQTAYEEYMKQYQPLGKKSPKFSGYLPRYERHPVTGEIYQNVLDLRRDKIYNFVKHVATWEWTSDIVRIERYEDLVANGTQSLIDYVERETGLKANCTPYPPQPNRIVHNPWNNDDDEKEFLQYLHEHMDWDAEALIGYYPTTY